MLDSELMGGKPDHYKTSPTDATASRDLHHQGYGQPASPGCVPSVKPDPLRVRPIDPILTAG